jgi:glycosyltransferase involved in cell wall biosynthesis
MLARPAGRHRGARLLVIFFTIVSRNYLGYALTLMQSLAAQHPDSRRYVALADRGDGDPDLDDPLFELVRIEDLDLPDFDAFVFRYDILELNTAIKPYVFRLLRQRHPDEAVIYLDPDVHVLAPLSAARALLEAGALAVLTPHLNAPTTDDRHPGELAILRSGTYNLGFVAIGAHEHATQLIAWWADKLEFGCIADPLAGLFTDQKWMDLVPGLFPDVHILRDDGYNLAYWNLAQRAVAHDGMRWTANADTLVFVHFSGVDVDRPHLFSRHQDRYRRGNLGALEPLYARYLECLVANEHARHRMKPYAFGAFGDGEPVTRPMRAVYRQYFDKGCSEAHLQPWQMPRDGYDLPCDEIAPRADAPITRLMYAAWKMRPDLHAAFDLGEREGREGFIRWYLRSAAREFRIPSRHIDPVRAAFSRGDGERAQWDAAGRARVSGTWPRLSAASLAVIDWSCRHRWALALYRRVPARWRHRLRRGLERSAFVPAAPEAPAATPLVAPPGASDGINLVGYARGEFGVAEILRNFADVLRHAQLPFGVRNVEIGIASRQNDRRLEADLDDTMRQDITLFCVNADQMPVVHEHFGPSAFAGRYNIGCWFWELERFPSRWHGAFDLVDEIWVLSDFVRNAITACTDKPVHVMPLALHSPQPAPLSRQALALPDDAFIVLASFDFNSWMTRKNPQAAIAAFRAAFPPERRDVRLLLKTINGQRLPAALRALHDAAADDDRIEVRDGFLDRAGMWALQAACDVYLSLHRSEGFGLGLAECMALARPVVATAYSGNLQFMDADNSGLVPYRLVPLAEGDYPDWRDQHWAEPDIAAAAALLRRLADDPAEARRLGAAARDSFARRFDTAVSAAAIRTRLGQIRAAALR